MKALKRSALFTLGLGILSLVAILFSHLALTDVWHGETEVALEWQMVRVGFLLILLFHVSSFVTLFQVLRTTRPG